MVKSLSPLRYPGGKSKIYDKIRNLIEINALNDKTYVEPFAGGFGIGIRLLCDNVVKSAVLNDYDSHIYHFWYAILHHTDDLVRMITDTPVTLTERKKQLKIYMSDTSDKICDGFATLFLNRVNFSGVIKGGPIGGQSQNGAYKINCRFQKKEIIKRIEKIASLKSRIKLYHCDANKLISGCLQNKITTSFFNIDPPYVQKGQRLYTNFFKKEEHIRLEETITKHLSKTQWVITYDDCDLVRDIYKNYYMIRYSIQHNVGNSMKGKELVITNIPKDSFAW